jgi:exocyst complex protein 7
MHALLTALADIDGVIAAIDRIRQPSDIKTNEEDIIRKGYVAIHRY